MCAAVLRGLSVYDLLCEDLDVPPSAEYAHVRPRGGDGRG